MSSSISFWRIEHIVLAQRVALRWVFKTAMLVLSRKVGERILIGNQVTVTVVRITGGGVRLGIEAPKEMTVIREELQDELQQSASDQHAKRVTGK